MTDQPFVHLHLHSQYSMLQSTIKAAPLVDQVLGLGMSAVAITDQANMFGAVEFHDKARKKGVQPILGAEVYLAPSGRTEKNRKRDNFHLQLLICNEKGYQNLCQLLTLGYFEGFHYVPRIDRELLATRGEGLIAITSSQRGEVAVQLTRGRRDEAIETCRFLEQTFGEGNVYLELQDVGWDGQRAANDAMRQLAREQGLPLVVTNHVHYLEQGDSYPHEALMCLGAQQTLQDVDRMRFPSDQFFLKSPAQMWALFPDDAEALKNTVAIAERATFGFPDETTYHFPILPGMEGEDMSAALRERAEAGLVKRLETVRERVGDESYEALLPVYRARLDEELGIIKSMGFSDYFLIVGDFVGWAKDHDIPVGPGRGSGAGSLVLYSLRITDIDPIRFDLLFERFLNPERISMPDVDIDFCQDRREEVIQYVNDAYGGREKVCQIITYGKMLAKAVIRDTGRVMGMTYGEVDRIAKLVPDQLKITLPKALKQEPRLVEACKEDPRVDKLLEIAQRLEGNTRHAGVHAAGLVISDRPLVDYLPLAVVTGTSVTQYDMKYAEQIGLIKFDFLGLKTLTQINDALAMARAQGKTELDLCAFNNCDLGDQETYQLLGRGDTLGVFQLESSGMRQLIGSMKPNTFEDIIAVVALYRPGPMGAGMHEEYVERKHGRKRVTYPHETLRPILENTYGIIVYQEQVMQIAREMAGYSLGGADQLRRAMGKKKIEEMEKHRGLFIDGAKDRGIPGKTAEDVYELLAHFAEYGFNKSHSAAYALIAYQTAYLKAHLPEEFFASLLTIESSNTDKVLLYIDDARKHGIEILPPDVNESRWRFTVVEGGVRFGLSAVKGIGETAIKSILAARKELGRFDSIDQFLGHVDQQKVNKRAMESLVKCGAFDSLGHPRAALMAGLDGLMESAARAARDREVGQESLFGATTPGVQARVPDVPEWKEKERLAFEKEALGFFITGHPMDAYTEEVERFATHDTATVREASDGASVSIAGIVTTVRETITKRGQGDRMGIARIEDLVGGIEVVFFPRTYKDAQAALIPDVPLLIEGSVKVGSDGSVDLVGDDVRLLQDVREARTKQVWIDLDVAWVDEDHLRQLRECLAAHEGGCSAGIKLTIPGQTETELRLPDDLRVEAVDALRDEVNQIFGRKVVRFR